MVIFQGSVTRRAGGAAWGPRPTILLEGQRVPDWFGEGKGLKSHPMPPLHLQVFCHLLQVLEGHNCITSEPSPEILGAFSNLLMILSNKPTETTPLKPYQSSGWGNITLGWLRGDKKERIPWPKAQSVHKQDVTDMHELEKPILPGHLKDDLAFIFLSTLPLGFGVGYFSIFFPLLCYIYSSADSIRKSEIVLL